MRLLSCLLLASLTCVVPATAASPDRFIPDDTHVVVHVRVKELLATEFMKKHGHEWLKKTIEEHPVLAPVTAQSGFDPLKDLDSLMVAARELALPDLQNPNGPLGLPLPTAGDQLIVLRGKFDVARIEMLLGDLARDNPEQVKIENLGQRKLFSVKVQDLAMIGTFLDKSTLALASKREYLTESIERLEGKKKGTLEPGLAAAIGRIDDKHHAWLAVGLPGWLKEIISIIPPAAEHLNKLSGITVELTATDLIAGRVAVQTGDRQAAEAIRKFLDQGKILAAVLLLQFETVGPTLAEAISSSKPTVEGEAIVVKLEINNAMMEKAKRRLAEEKKNGDKNNGDKKEEKKDGEKKKGKDKDK